MTLNEAKAEATEIANLNRVSVFVCTSRHYCVQAKDFWTVCAAEARWMMGDDATIVATIRPEAA